MEKNASVRARHTGGGGLPHLLDRRFSYLLGSHLKGFRISFSLPPNLLCSRLPLDRDLRTNTWKMRIQTSSISITTDHHTRTPPTAQQQYTPTMIVKLLLLSYYIASLDAFLTPPPLHASTINSIESSWQVKPSASSPSPVHRSTASTILRADASDGAEADDSSSSDDDSSSETKASLLPSEEESDILSSPTFLKRKVEVLQSDIAALEKEIEEANAVAAKGKEEWAAKFDMLTKEVRNVCAKCRGSLVISPSFHRILE